MPPLAVFEVSRLYPPDTAIQVPLLLYRGFSIKAVGVEGGGGVKTAERSILRNARAQLDHYPLLSESFREEIRKSF